MKKFVSMILIMALLLSGCGNSTGSTSEKGTSQGTASTESKGTESTETPEFTIGVVQLLEHKALDEAYRGFEEGLKEQGVHVNVVYKNAQGEIPNANTIVQKFVSDDVDLIYAIATPAAQAAQQQTSTIPIVFSAVTDAVESGLVASNEAPGGNITGTSDMAPMEAQLKAFKDINPDIKNIGIVYSTGEANSAIQIEQAKKLAEPMGLNIVEMGITTLNDIPQALESIVKNVEGIYTITDNMVASSITTVADKAKENKIVTVAAEDAHVKGGILYCDGISYYELGKQASVMAKKILVDGMNAGEIPVETAKNTTKVYNEETLKALGLDASKAPFADAVPMEITE